MTLLTNNQADVNYPDIKRLFSVAPMLDWTDKHCRYFHRLLSQHALLYTEMVTTGAIIYGDSQRHLAFNVQENPVALQLGGSNPQDLARCAQMAVEYGYREVNLNVGCPSDRVQNGRFGACLMATPSLVADCVAAMQQVVAIPVTVKCRIGIDELDSYEELVAFVRTIADAGCATFIVHARKAWLSGLSPKQNRDVPPLRYDVVYQLKQDFPQLEIILNGGLTSLADCDAVLSSVDGVMVGREVYHNPYLLGTVDHAYYGDTHAIPSRAAIIEAFMPYMHAQIQAGVRLNSMTRHILGLFHGQPGARAWRRYLSEHACKTGAGINVVAEALKLTQL
ncbi:MAG: tRNA dihydrouridine(20/20a) synthase DusA [Methylococcales bacterium]|nr:tRNA dihydrouridine(20/20a) synthase DusA [Methylococcales bacterium]